MGKNTLRRPIFIGLVILAMLVLLAQLKPLNMELTLASTILYCISFMTLGAIIGTVSIIFHERHFSSIALISYITIFSVGLAVFCGLAVSETVVIPLLIGYSIGVGYGLRIVSIPQTKTSFKSTMFKVYERIEYSDKRITFVLIITTCISIFHNWHNGAMIRFYEGDVSKSAIVGAFWGGSVLGAIALAILSWWMLLSLRRMALIGFILMIAATALYLSPHIWESLGWFIATRFIQGVSNGFGSAAITVLYREIQGGDRKNQMRGYERLTLFTYGLGIAANFAGFLWESRDGSRPVWIMIGVVLLFISTSLLIRVDDSRVGFFREAVEEKTAADRQQIFTKMIPILVFGQLVLIAGQVFQIVIPQINASAWIGLPIACRAIGMIIGPPIATRYNSHSNGLITAVGFGIVISLVIPSLNSSLGWLMIAGLLVGASTGVFSNIVNADIYTLAPTVRLRRIALISLSAGDMSASFIAYVLPTILGAQNVWYVTMVAILLYSMFVWRAYKQIQ